MGVDTVLQVTQVVPNPRRARHSCLVFVSLALVLGCGQTASDGEPPLDETPQPDPPVDTPTVVDQPEVVEQPDEIRDPVDDEPTPEVSRTTRADVAPPEQTMVDDGGALPFETLDPTCASDDLGNWVCVFQAGRSTHAGPCAFGPSGTLTVAHKVVWTDSHATTTISRFDAGGHGEWTRGWYRPGALTGTTVTARGLVVDANGGTIWAGQDCVTDSGLPQAEEAGWYSSSCLDAYLVTLDEAGSLVDELRFGVSAGLDRASDLVLSPDGSVILAGSYQAPLELPGHETLASQGGVDHYVMRYREGNIDWVYTWGTAEDDGNDVRIAETPEGTIFVGQTFGLSAGDSAPVAALSSSGELLWQQEVPGGYIFDVAALDEERAVTSDLKLVEEGGVATDFPGPTGFGIAKLEAMEDGRIAFAAQSGVGVATASEAGLEETLRTDAGLEGWWYEGGLCVASDGSIGVSGTVSETTDFGLLDEPIEVHGFSAFVMVVRDL